MTSEKFIPKSNIVYLLTGDKSSHVNLFAELLHNDLYTQCEWDGVNRNQFPYFDFYSECSNNCVTKTQSEKLKIAEKLLNKFLENSNHQFVIVTHSEIFYTTFRLFIAEGKLKPEQLRFLYLKEGDSNPIEIEVSLNGNIVNWPDGFMDFGLKLESRITELSIQNRSKS